MKSAKNLSLLAILLVLAVSCSTTQPQEASDEAASSNTQDFGDTSEKDISQDLQSKTADQLSDKGSPGDKNLGRESANKTRVAQRPSAQNSTSQNFSSQDAQVPSTPEEIPNPSDSPPPLEASIPSGKPARVTSLDFNGNLNGGTVILKTNKPVTYTTRKNAETNQLVIELQNTLVPKQFRRPYNTKEFSSSIGSINAYQARGSGRVARIVIQLKDASEPGIAQNGRIINIAASGGPAPAVTDSPAQNLATESVTTSQENSSESFDEANSSGTSNVKTDDQVTESGIPQLPSGQKAMSDFLLGTTKYYGKPMSLEVKDADIKDVFRLISEESGINILVQDDVTGKISLKLRKIPWDQVLTVLLQSRQLGYVKQGNILRIAPLKSIEAESDAAKKVMDSQRDLLPLRVKLFPVSYALATDLEIQVKDLLTPRGKARADKRTNMLVVTDIDEVIGKIKVLVNRLDTQTPQVLIEAKVVEARESFQKLVGVNWGFTGAATQVGSNSQNAATMFQPKLNVQPITDQQGGQFGVGFHIGGIDLLGDLDASLKLLESEGIVKVISAPRIVTLDRQDAKIQQTTSFPTFSSTIGANGVAASAVTFQDVRLELGVKPQISADGGIIMDVNVLREFADAPVTQPNGSSARAVNRRQATTKVLVENGDTVVIGGIYQSDVAEGESGVPFLRKIPFLGALFRQRNSSREKNELVIFLTPRILNREKAFANGDG